MRMLDCIIVGSGPAGISAALTLQANGKSFCLFGSSGLSEKISKAELIRNYPGLFNVTGQAFCQALQTQLQASEIAVIEEKVSGVYALKGKFSVLTNEGGAYESKTVILACGVENIRPIDGEERFFGRGVSYCATCDGMLYKNKTIAVFCTTKRLEHEIAYLADLAKHVYLIPMYKDMSIARENITVIRKMPMKLEGGMRITGLRFAIPPLDGGSELLEIDGMFMLRESVSPAVLTGGLQTENGHVVVDRLQRTNLPGCFAAGDCTGRPYQYAKAIGEGNVAAHAVGEYLSENP